MCNPRKVMIFLARKIEEQWRQTVRESHGCRQEVGEAAVMTVEINLEAEMGDLALAMFGRVLAGEFAGFSAWEKDDAGNLVRQLDDVRLVYRPAEAVLQLEASRSRLVQAQASGEATASGRVDGTLAASAAGRYYDDGWGGQTAAWAAATASRRAASQLAAAEESLRSHQQAEALFAASRSAGREAERQATAALAEKTTAARRELRQELRDELARVEERVFAELNRAVGEAYRQTLRHLVLSNGGRIIADEQTGAVINMELELY